MNSQFLSLRGSLPPRSTYVAGSILPLTQRRIHVKPTRRQSSMLNAFDADSIFSSSKSLAWVAVAAMGVTGVVALGLTGTGIQKGRVFSITPSKLEGMLNSRDSIIVDIRSKDSIKEFGSPNLRGLKCRFLACPYTKLDKSDSEQVVAKYGEVFSKLRGLRESSNIILMDTNGTLAPSAAKEILSYLKFNTIYYVANGASGKSGLQSSGFNWKEPQKGISIPKIDVKGLDLDKIAESYKQRPTVYNTGLAFGAILSASIILFNEFDVVLEAVGILGGANIILKNFVFAKDRKKTIDNLDSLVNEKIGAKEAAADLKKLATAILEVNPDATDKSTNQADEASKGSVAESVTNAVPVSEP